MTRNPTDTPTTQPRLSEAQEAALTRDGLPLEVDRLIELTAYPWQTEKVLRAVVAEGLVTADALRARLPQRDYAEGTACALGMRLIARGDLAGVPAWVPGEAFLAAMDAEEVGA